MAKMNWTRFVPSRDHDRVQRDDGGLSGVIGSIAPPRRTPRTATSPVTLDRMACLCPDMRRRHWPCPALGRRTPPPPRAFVPYRDPRRLWGESDWLTVLFSPHYHAEPEAF